VATRARRPARSAWPEIQAETIFLETPEDATKTHILGQSVSILSDPRHPTRARLAGFTRQPWGSLAVTAGGLFLSSGYIKWWRWLVVAHRKAPPTPPGRHRAGSR